MSRRRRQSARVRMRRAAKAEARRVARAAMKEDEKVRRVGEPHPEPPEGLSGEDLDNWKADQRIARRIQRLKEMEDAYEAGQTVVEGWI